MSPISDDSAQDTRRRLLEAAIVLFAEKGFDGTGIREIAARAKANSAMVQYHFGGKEGLYLEMMRFTFEHGPTWIHTLGPPPRPEAPDARAQALERLKEYMFNFLADLLGCQGGCQLGTEVDRAANILWNREMQYPREHIGPFIEQSIRPFSDYLNACLRVLRPDLDAEGLIRMSISIQAQAMWVHSHIGLTRILRGAAYTEADLESLAAHFYQFALGGLGLPEAGPRQGAPTCR